MKTSRSLIAAVVVSGLAITSGGSALAASKTTTVTKTTSKLHQLTKKYQVHQRVLAWELAELKKVALKF
jgi:hypothetical protein